MQITFTARIIQELTKMANSLISSAPDTKHNAGRLLSIAFMWDAIEKYARAQSGSTWAKIEKEQFIETKKLTAGDYDLCESPHFMVKAKVTKPYKKFNMDEFSSKLAKGKYKVPTAYVRETYEAAQLDDKPRVTLSIVERDMT